MPKKGLAPQHVPGLTWPKEQEFLARTVAKMHAQVQQDQLKTPQPPETIAISPGPEVAPPFVEIIIIITTMSHKFEGAEANPQKALLKILKKVLSKFH